ncbi:cytochrome P450 family protein [Ceratobasidium sp. AG-Ba]|nr:cytochrome P450 family protein [Ceratobasidium sp. AG-Ba]
MKELTSRQIVLPTVGALAILAGFGYHWLKPRPLKGIPHNPVTSILGDISEITQILKRGDKTLYDYYEILVERHGSITQLCAGNNSMLIVADPAEVDRIIVKGKNIEAIRFARIIYGRITPTGQIALPTDVMWKIHRRMFGPMLNQEYLSRMVNRISASATSLVELRNAKLKLANGKAFSAELDIKLAMLFNIGHVALGSPLECVESAQKSLSSPVSTSGQVVEFENQATPPIYNSMRTLFTHLEKKIKDARKNDNREGDCILDILLKREKEEGERLSQEELLDELLLMFIGGQESTSATLFWFVKYMASDTDIQRRLHDEVCNVFGDDMAGLTLDALKDSERVPILEAVVAETLRCAMLAGAVARYLTEDEVIMGHHILKGTEIIIPISLMGMDRTAWGPDVKEWRPTRWLRSDGSFDPHAGPSGHPFGLGKRSCFGDRLAIVKLKVFIAVMSRAFRFKPVPEEVGSMHAFTRVTRQPKQCYVLLDKWEA